MLLSVSSFKTNSNNVLLLSFSMTYSQISLYKSIEFLKLVDETDANTLVLNLISLLILAAIVLIVSNL